jgi:hypothetical protein
MCPDPEHPEDTERDTAQEETDEERLDRLVAALDVANRLPPARPRRPGALTPPATACAAHPDPPP